MSNPPSFLNLFQQGTMQNINSVSKKLKQPIFIVNYNTQQLVSNQSIILLDGYEFSGRLFEDVIFKIKISPNNDEISVFAVSDYDYLKEQGENKWLKEALNSVADISNRGSFVSIENASGTFVLCNELCLQEHYPHLVTKVSPNKQKP